MNQNEQLFTELTFLNRYYIKAIIINTTSKHNMKFRVLPRRIFNDMAIASFMINDEKLLKETLHYFDGKIDRIYIDVELKQKLNLFNIARKEVSKSQLITIKPNDITLESADIMIRNHFKDDLYNKTAVIIGNGNLASKLAIRLAERQAKVYILGRNEEKVTRIVKVLNLFLPKYSPSIKTLQSSIKYNKADLVVSFLSGQFTEEDKILPLIHRNSFIIDGGINNFTKSFIQTILRKNLQIVRLDTRIAIPYQVLSENMYTKNFFKDNFGKSFINDIPIVSGGYIGDDGSVIVDNLKAPSQVIGVADGRGGVKLNEQYSQTDKQRYQQIQQIITKEY